MPIKLFMPSGATVILPDLRGEVPTYSPPDRAEWERTHGAAPYGLAVAEKFVGRAQAALRRDEETISFDRAMKAQTDLDRIAADVQAIAGLPQTTLVFFDSKSVGFWAYPLGTQAEKFFPAKAV